MSELLCELVRHWEDVVAIFLNTVHVALVEASGDMQMRFALWSIIMQIGKKIFSLSCSSWGSDFVLSMFCFCGVKYKIRPVKYSSTVRILLTCDVSHMRCVCFPVLNGIRVTFSCYFMRSCVCLLEARVSLFVAILCDH